jgi:predicted GTPase
VGDAERQHVSATLQNRIREEFGFAGTPIVIKSRRRK